MHLESLPLYLGETGLDRFFGPLAPGEIIYAESPWELMPGLVYTIIVSALRESRSRVVHVDGCNIANPYRITRLARRFGIDHNEALTRVQVCRAFTAYQMSTVIDDRLEERLSGCRLLAVTGMQYLYQDRDIRHVEAKVMLRRAVSNIGRLTRRYDLVTVMTDILRRSVNRDLGEMLREMAHRHWRFLPKGNGLRLFDVGTGKSTDHVPVPPDQALLDEYSGVI